MSRIRPPSRPPFLFLSSLLLLPPLMVQAQPAQAPHHHDRKEAKQQITDLEEQWRAATVGGDAVAMDKLLSEDYVGISWTGQVNTKAMQLDRTKNRTLVISRMDLSDIKVKVVGPVAIVTSRAEVVGTNDGTPINGAFRYTRVYQRVPSGGWKITNFEATRIPPGTHEHKSPPPSQPPVH